MEGSFLIEKNLQDKIDKVPKDKFYRINFDKVFLSEAIKNIKDDPLRYLTLYIKRTISYFFIDIESSKYNYYNRIHYLPVLLLGITSLIGIYLSDKKSYQLNYLIFIILFLSLISGRNPQYLIGEHVKSAPVIKSIDLM